MNTNKLWAQRMIWVVLAISIAFFVARYNTRLTDGFSLAHIINEMPYNPKWETAPLNAEEKQNLHSILNQPYRYIGKGAQSYVFISEDGQYVIKFFKFKHLRPNWLVQSLPDLPLFNHYKAKKNARKSRLIDSVFAGYKLAYDIHKERSGLVFIHLNLSGNLEERIVLYDKKGSEYTLDLDNFFFILQKSVRTTREVLEEAFNKKDVALGSKRIGQIIDLYLCEYKMGIYDRDHGIVHNTGFAGEEAIHLDVGKLTHGPDVFHTAFYKKDLIRVRERFESWLKTYYPQYHDEIMLQWNKKMSEVF